MPTRRHALHTAALAAAAASIAPRRAFSEPGTPAFPSRRPPLGERRFTSPAVEATIAAVKREVADPELAWLFENCFPNTLDTTVQLHGARRQARHVRHHRRHRGHVAARLVGAGVAVPAPREGGPAPCSGSSPGSCAGRRPASSIDPYANAFNDGPKGSEWAKDLTDMKPELHERKWEIDSLCYPVRLAHGYWKTTGDASIFDAEWRAAAAAILRTFREQQRKEGPGPYSLPPHDECRLRHRSARWLWEPDAPGRPHPLGLPPVGRRLRLPVPGAVEPLRGRLAAAAGRDLGGGARRTPPSRSSAGRWPTRWRRP